MDVGTGFTFGMHADRSGYRLTIRRPEMNLDEARQYRVRESATGSLRASKRLTGRQGVRDLVGQSIYS